MERSEIDSLKADLRRMQARVDELETNAEEPTNRRNMLRGLGAAAVGAAAGGLAFARPAAANDTDSIIIGSDVNNGETPTTLLADAASWDIADTNFRGIFNVTNDTNFSDVNASFSCIAAYADDTAGSDIHNIALWGASANGIGAKLHGPVPLKLTSAETSVPQGGGTPGQFRVIRNSLDTGDRDLWFCVDDDGSHRWRKLCGPQSAGTFHAITPIRCYDSRQAGMPSPGILNSNASRTISLAASRTSAGAIINANAVPDGATAVMANLTITATTGTGGFLSVNPGGDISQLTSAINWFGASQNLANGLALTMNTSRQVTVVCGAGGGNTHFLVDVSGYWL